MAKLHVRKGTLEGSSWTSGAGTGTLRLRGARHKPKLNEVSKRPSSSFVCWYCELAALLTARLMLLYARTTCMYLCNEECNVNYVLRVCTYAMKNVK